MDTWNRLRRIAGSPAVSAILWILVVGFLGYRLWPQLSAVSGVGERDEPSPTLEALTLDGDTVRTERLRGDVVLVNVWATWCPPCRLEMPGLEDVYRSRRHRGLRVLALSLDHGNVGAVRRFVSEHDLTFPVAMATPSMRRALGGVHAVPTTFLIDRSGRLRHEVRGFMAEPVLAAAVDRLLDEPPPPSTTVRPREPGAPPGSLEDP